MSSASRLSCASCEAQMSDYLEDALLADERRIVDLHFESCDACSELRVAMAEVLQWGKIYPVQEPPAWLAMRIVANTPKVVRVTWRDLWAAAWRNITEPRFAMTLFTATLVLGWLGNLTGVAPTVGMMVRHPSAIYYGVEGFANRAYGEIVRNYYRSRLVIEIQCQIHTRIEQLREIS